MDHSAICSGYHMTAKGNETMIRTHGCNGTHCKRKMSIMPVTAVPIFLSNSLTE